MMLALIISTHVRVEMIRGFSESIPKHNTFIPLYLPGISATRG